MYPINASIREISDNSWLIADHLMLSRQETDYPGSLASWSDENGAVFVLSTASAPIPKTRALSATSGLLQKVYDAGDASAVWRVGEAFIKLKDLITPNATREHTTLQYLRDKHPLDFKIPEVYYHADLGKRYLIILGRLPGLTLNELWYEMDETTRQACVSRIANICKSLTAWTGESISGVDGNQLTEQYLIKPRAEMDFDPSHLLKSCDEMGMACSSLFVFYHCDLGPGNILFDETDCSIGIIDWETAGYVPREWIRTKFRCSSGMDLPQKSGEVIPQHDWRKRVSQELEKLGFSDVVENWLSWWVVR